MLCFIYMRCTWHIFIQIRLNVRCTRWKEPKFERLEPLSLRNASETGQSNKFFADKKKNYVCNFYLFFKYICDGVYVQLLVDEIWSTMLSNDRYLLSDDPIDSGTQKPPQNLRDKINRLRFVYKSANFINWDVANRPISNVLKSSAQPVHANYIQILQWFIYFFLLIHAYFMH